MPIKKDSYVYNQLTFALLGLSTLTSEKALKEALSSSLISEMHDELSSEVLPEHSELLDFIFDDLLATEDDNDRINEIFGMMDDLDIGKFISSYRYPSEGKSGEYTNGCIETIATQIVADIDPKSVLDIGCGQGVFLAEAIMCGIGEEHYGIEISEKAVAVAKLKMRILLRNENIISKEDVFCNEFTSGESRKFDAVFCHMPMLMSLDKDKLVSSGLFDEHDAAKISKRDTEWAFIRAMHKMTKPEGKSIAIVRTGTLFTEPGKKFRKELVDRGILEGVILLPANLLYDSGVQTAMIVLSNNNQMVRMIDASSYCVKGRRNNVITEGQINFILELYLRAGQGLCGKKQYLGNSETLEEEYIEVSRDTVAENDYSLEPKRYQIKEQVTFNNERKLSEATTKIFRGVQIKADELDVMSDFYDNYPNCALLNLSNISNGYIDENLEEVFVEDIDRYEKYMISEGDVIIPARGTKIAAAVVEGLNGRKIIATGNLIVIRCHDSLNPYYLKGFLDSNDGRALLKSVQTGSMIFAINPKQLRDLSYENLDLEKQNQIGEKVKWLVSELKESHKRSVLLEQELLHVYEDAKEV